MALPEFSSNGLPHSEYECTPEEIQASEERNGPLLMCIGGDSREHMQRLDLPLDASPDLQSGLLYAHCTSFMGPKLIMIETPEHLEKYRELCKKQVGVLHEGFYKDV